MAPRAATGSEEPMGSVTGHVLLRLLRGNKAGLCSHPPAQECTFQEAGNATFPAGTQHGTGWLYPAEMPRSVGTHLPQPHGCLPGCTGSAPPSRSPPPHPFGCFWQHSRPVPFNHRPHLQRRSPGSLCNRIKHTGVTDKAGACLLVINPLSELYLQTPALPQGPQAAVSPYSWAPCAGSCQTPRPPSPPFAQAACAERGSPGPYPYTRDQPKPRDKCPEKSQCR